MITPPIHIKTKLKVSEIDNNSQSEVLELIIEYLEDKGLTVTSKTDNGLVFWNNTGHIPFATRSLLGSGVIKLVETKYGFLMICGTWIPIILALFLIAFYIVSTSRFSTIDFTEVKWISSFIAIVIFINIVIRAFAYNNLGYAIRDIIEKKDNTNT